MMIAVQFSIKAPDGQFQALNYETEKANKQAKKKFRES